MQISEWMPLWMPVCVCVFLLIVNMGHASQVTTLSLLLYYLSRHQGPTWWWWWWCNKSQTSQSQTSAGGGEKEEFVCFSLLLLPFSIGKKMASCWRGTTFFNCAWVQLSSAQQQQQQQRGEIYILQRLEQQQQKKREAKKCPPPFSLENVAGCCRNCVTVQSPSELCPIAREKERMCRAVAVRGWCAHCAVSCCCCITKEEEEEKREDGNRSPCWMREGEMRNSRRTAACLFICCTIWSVAIRCDAMWCAKAKNGRRKFRSKISHCAMTATTQYDNDGETLSSAATLRVKLRIFLLLSALTLRLEAFIASSEVDFGLAKFFYSFSSIDI